MTLDFSAAAAGEGQVALELSRVETMRRKTYLRAGSSVRVATCSYEDDEKLNEHRKTTTTPENQISLEVTVKDI